MAFYKMSSVILLKLTYNMFAAVKGTVFMIIIMKISYKIHGLQGYSFHLGMLSYYISSNHFVRKLFDTDCKDMAS